MTKPKNKPKTGDVVGWVVIDRDGDHRSHERMKSRKEARARKLELIEGDDKYGPFHIAKIVIA